MFNKKISILIFIFAFLFISCKSRNESSNNSHASSDLDNYIHASIIFDREYLYSSINDCINDETLVIDSIPNCTIPKKLHFYITTANDEMIYINDSLYVCDMNGDGINDLCFNSVDSGGWFSQHNVYIYDYYNQTMIAEYIGEKNGKSFFLSVIDSYLVLQEFTPNEPKMINWDQLEANSSKVFVKSGNKFYLSDYNYNFLYRGCEFYLCKKNESAVLGQSHLLNTRYMQVQKGKYYLYGYVSYTMLTGKTNPITNSIVNIKSTDNYTVFDVNYSETIDKNSYVNSPFLKEIEFKKNGKYEINIEILGLVSVVYVEVID